MKISLTTLALAGSLLVSANAFADEKADAAKPDPRIGEEEKQICFAQTINGWKPLKGVDDVVLLQKGVNDWYYVELTGYCPSRVFQTAEAIGIESKPAGGCLTKGDVIIVQDTGGFPSRCFVTKISKWDDKAKAPEAEEEGDKKNDN